MKIFPLISKPIKILKKPKSIYSVVSIAAQQTIDHFRPKKQLPFLTYVWHNLFLACNVCQNSKQDRYDKKLLAPDTVSFKKVSVYL
jgi:uncharacterized protein (TIGR02646 family)